MGDATVETLIALSVLDGKFFRLGSSWFPSSHTDNNVNNECSAVSLSMTWLVSMQKRAALQCDIMAALSQVKYKMGE